MKSYFAALLLILLFSCSGEVVNQEVNTGGIPDAVKASFEKSHPKAAKIKWEKEGDYYEAEYMENGVEISMLYDAKGNLVETEIEIDEEKLPELIDEYIRKNFKDVEIEDAEKIDNPKGSFYEVEIEIGDKEIELLFDSEGNFLRKEVEIEEDEDDDHDHDNDHDDDHDHD